MNQFERDTIADEAHGKSEQQHYAQRTRVSNTHARSMGLLSKAIVQTCIGQLHTVDGIAWHEAIRKLHSLLALLGELEYAAASQADAIVLSDLPEDQSKVMQGKREQAENNYARLQCMREELTHEFQTQLGDAYGVKIH